LSTFGLNKKLVDNKEIIEFDEVVVMVNYLIEYVIINPENTENTFSGYVYLYKLKPDPRVNSKNLTVDSKIDELKSLILIKEFMALSLENTILFINNFINLINSQNTVDGRVIFVPPNKFPIYYRPSNSMYAIISTSPQANSNNKAIENTNNIYKKIQLNATADFKGYGLINSQNQVGFPRRTKKTLENVFKYDSTPTTYGSLGADKIFLLSQKSEIPGKGKINFDGTLYGISNDKYVDDIIPKTSSLVRGEELIELLNLIVRFLLTHTHSFPLLPPLPVGYDGTNSSIILTELQNAYNKILNENIRLN
jgi:hypothetical protein